MSDAPDTLNLRETLVRIDRMIEEAAKFRAERDKLTAEAAKFNHERFLAPIFALVATLGAIAALTPSIVRALAGHG